MKPDTKIIFLISQPRSGSTLLQAILGTHPDVHTCSEPWIALPFVYALKEEGSEFEFNGSWSKVAIKAFFNESGIDESFYHTTLNSFLSSLYEKSLERAGKKAFLDKTPRYYEIATDLIKIFPEAKFIVLYRHPLSILNSILKTWVKGDLDNLFYFSRDLLVAPKKLKDFVSEYRHKICVVKYEDLAGSPEEELERICKYIEIEYKKEIINYNSQGDWVFGDKNFKDKNSPDTSSLYSWQKQLPDKRTANFLFYYLAELGKDLFKTLGYDYDSALAEIKKYHPNRKDFKAWQRLLIDQHIISIEEQRIKVRDSISGKNLKSIYKKIVS